MAQVPAGAHTLQLLTYLAQQATPVAASAMAREVTAGQASLARAVVDASGYPVVAVAVTYPVEDRSEALLDGLTHHLDNTVHTLAQRLGAER